MVILPILQVVSTLLAALAMALSLAHALELPGKRRLDRETYLAVQWIYYPGFTIGGLIGEPGGMVAVLVLLLLTPAASVAFWLTLAALLMLAIMHGIYWAVTHKINRAWAADRAVGAAGSAFLDMGSRMTAGRADEQGWVVLRDRWEYSHVARAVFGILALVALVTALVV